MRGGALTALDGVGTFTIPLLLVVQDQSVLIQVTFKKSKRINYIFNQEDFVKSINLHVRKTNMKEEFLGKIQFAIKGTNNIVMQIKMKVFSDNVD